MSKNVEHTTTDVTDAELEDNSMKDMTEEQKAELLKLFTVKEEPEKKSRKFVEFIKAHRTALGLGLAGAAAGALALALKGHKKEELEGDGVMIEGTYSGSTDEDSDTDDDYESTDEVDEDEESVEASSDDEAE